MKEPKLIKVNLPQDEEAYKHGVCEGCFFIVDDRTKTAYDLDATGGEYYGILDNDSLYYPGLKHGERLQIEMRGKQRPVVPLKALRKWKARPIEEVLGQCEEYLAGEREEDDFAD